MLWFQFGLISLFAASIQLLWWRMLPFRGTGWILARLVPCVCDGGRQPDHGKLLTAEAQLVQAAAGWLLALPFALVVFVLSVISKWTVEMGLSLILSTATLVGALFSIRWLLQVAVTLLIRDSVGRVVGRLREDPANPSSGA